MTIGFAVSKCVKTGAWVKVSLSVLNACRRSGPHENLVSFWVKRVRGVTVSVKFTIKWQ